MQLKQKKHKSIKAGALCYFPSILHFLCPAAVGKHHSLPKNPELFGFHSTLSEAGLLFLFILALFPLKVISLGF